MRATQNVSIRKIAERIEYSPAAIYGYFPSKDDIFFALAEEGFRLLYGDRGAARRRRRRCRRSSGSAPSSGGVYQFSCEHPQYFALMFVDRSVPRVSREYERFAFAREVKARADRARPGVRRRRRLAADVAARVGRLPPADRRPARRRHHAAVRSARPRRKPRRPRPRRARRHHRRPSFGRHASFNRRRWRVRSTPTGGRRTPPQFRSQSCHRVVIRQSLRSSCSRGARPLVRLCSTATAGPPNPPPRRPRRSRSGRRGTRTADRPFHPRHRQPDRRRTGRRRGRDAGRVIAHAGRARHAGQRRAGADPAVADRNRCAGAGGRSQRGADRSAARPDAGHDLRRQRRARGAERQRRPTRWRRASSPASSRCSISAWSRSRNSTSAGPRWKRRGSRSKSAKNTAAQQYQALQGARARVTLAQKALADTVVRAPFAGVVAERMVSVGDYVTKGMKVAVVVRVNPLRVRADRARAVRLGDGRRPAGVVRGRRLSRPDLRRQGALRLAGARDQPARADRRSGRPQSGRRAQAGPVRHARASSSRQERPACSCRRAAVQTTAGTSRVFVVNGDHVEERHRHGRTDRRRSWSRSPTG